MKGRKKWQDHFKEKWKLLTVTRLQSFQYQGLPGVPGFNDEAFTVNLGRNHPIFYLQHWAFSQHLKHPLHPSACLTYWRRQIRTQSHPLFHSTAEKVAKSYRIGGAYPASWLGTGNVIYETTTPVEECLRLSWADCRPHLGYSLARMWASSSLEMAGWREEKGKTNEQYSMLAHACTTLRLQRISWHLSQDQRQ